MREPLKVALVITDLDIGGAELALHRYISAVLPTGEFKFVVCSLRPPGPVAQSLSALGVPVSSVRLTRGNLPLAMYRLSMWLQQEKPAVVCSFMFHANILTRVLRRSARIPALFCFERTMAQESWLRYLLNRVTAPRADLVVAVAPAVKRFCEQRIGIPAEKVVVLTNGVEVAPFRDLPDRAESRKSLGCAADEVVFTCVANLRAIKGHTFLIQAFAELFAGGPRCRLLLVGEGPLRVQLEDQVQRLGLTGSVTFCGAATELRPIFAASDVFVMPSLIEGMSNAILEAMAAGLPVVATRVGGNVDVIIDGQSGLLVEAASPRALADAMAQLASDPSRRATLGSAARARVESHYSLESVGEEFRQLLLRGDALAQSARAGQF
jgi:glycosyltransferase involved in cell wall biosynthesis